MSPSNPSTRLARLDQILTQSPPAPASRTGDVDPGQVHLTSVPLDRIKGLTTELRERADSTPDDIDALTIRLLFNDYKAAVAHLRAVANGVDGRLHAVTGELHHMRKTLRRAEELAAKRSALAADEVSS